jgi:hypothetical protein
VAYTAFDLRIGAPERFILIRFALVPPKALTASRG